MAKRCLRRDKELISITTKAFHTLIVLLEHKGRIVEKDVLLNEVWQDTFVKESTYPIVFPQLENFSACSPAANSLLKLKKKVYNLQIIITVFDSLLIGRFILPLSIKRSLLILKINISPPMTFSKYWKILQNIELTSLLPTFRKMH